jgi:hypothetical protein
MDNIEKDAPNNSTIVACVFVVAVTFLLRRCLVTIEGIHTQTHRLMGGIYEVAAETGSGVMIYKISFIKIGSAIQKFIMGYTNRQQDEFISLL